MNKKQVKDLLIESLKPFFKSHGFKTVKGKNHFIKKTENGFWRVSFGIIDYEPEFWIRFALSIRRDEIAEIYNQFADKNPNSFPDTPTLLVMQGNLMNSEEFHYTVFQPEDVENACRNFMEFMEEEGFDFFENFDDLGKMDEVINSNPKQPNIFLKRDLTRAINGLIIAKKTHHRNFDQLVSSYKELLADHDADDRAKIDQLTHFLKK